MRHVSRTHRVALDRLFDRINLDPKNPFNYVDTKHQLADMLTKGNFTRDEWNNLLHLFNISHFSSICWFDTKNELAEMVSKGSFTRNEWEHLFRFFFNIMKFSTFSCSHFLSFNLKKKPNTMSKRLDIKKLGRETIPTLDSGASYSLWNHTLGWTSDSTSTERSVRYRVEHPTASYQEWDRDDNPFSSTGKPVREINQRSSIGKPVRGILNQFTSVKLDYHNLQVSL